MATSMSCPRGCCPDYRTHIQGVRIGGFPSENTVRERKLAADMRAYKNLRRDGLQPRQIDGSYVLERSARNEREVEMGRPIDKTSLSMFKDANI